LKELLSTMYLYRCNEIKNNAITFISLQRTNLTKINEIIGPLTNSLYSNDGKRERGRLLIKSAFDSIARRVR